MQITREEGKWRARRSSEVGKVMEDWEPRGGGGPALGKIRGLDLFRLGGADS